MAQRRRKGDAKNGAGRKQRSGRGRRRAASQQPTRYVEWHLNMGVPLPSRAGQREERQGKRKVRDRIIELVPRGLSAALPSGWGARLILRVPETDLLRPLATLLQPSAWRQFVSKPVERQLAGKAAEEQAGYGTLPWGGASGDGDPDSVLVLRGLSLEEVEREAIRLSLRRHHGKRVSAQRELKCAKSTLMERIARWGLRDEGRIFFPQD